MDPGEPGAVADAGAVADGAAGTLAGRSAGERPDTGVDAFGNGAFDTDVFGTGEAAVAGYDAAAAGTLDVAPPVPRHAAVVSAAGAPAMPAVVP